MSAVQIIADGFEVKVGCADGGLIDVQLAEEDRKPGAEPTWELMLSKSADGTITGLYLADLDELAGAISELTKAIRRARA